MAVVYVAKTCRRFWFWNVKAEFTATFPATFIFGIHKCLFFGTKTGFESDWGSEGRRFKSSRPE